MEWKKFVSSLLAFLRVSLATVRKNWALSNAVSLVRGFQASLEVFTFKPELSVSALPAGERRGHTAALVARIKPERVNQIERAVQEAFENETKSIPPYLLQGMGTSVRSRGRYGALRALWNLYRRSSGAKLLFSMSG